MEKPKFYPVSIVTGPPVFDSLPVAKIIDYPMEQRDYRPFAQCILCAGAAHLYLRMWAFEVSVAPTSALVWVGYLFPDKPHTALAIRMEHGEDHKVETRISLLEQGDEVPLPADAAAEMERCLEQHPHNGEDLQGVYWGRTLTVPLAAVELAGGKTDLAVGRSFPGNFYKLCSRDPFVHMGSFFPARFPDNPMGRDSMGEFRAVGY